MVASHRARSRRTSPKARRWRIGAGVFAVLVLVVVAAGAGYFYYLNAKIHRVEVHNLSPSSTSGAEANAQNILMIGSTSRCALSVQNPAYGLCSNGVNGINGDVIMILHLNPSTKSVTLLSIPRDLFLPNARSGPYGGYKIDAALYQGQSQLIKVIREDFGIPIQHSVLLNFDTFANVVNDLGGINMYFPMPVFDAYSGLNIPRAGCVHLNGYHALQVVRARHLQYRPASVKTGDHAFWPYELQSDLGRINRDHEFLRVLAASVAKQGLGNPLTDLHLVNSVAGQLEFDNAFTTSDMVHLLLTFHSVKINSAPQLTIPVSVGPNVSYIYGGFPKGDIEFPALTPDERSIDKFLQIGSDTNTLRVVRCQPHRR
jgi:LCP family protein required for cell wall assembly